MKLKNKKIIFPIITALIVGIYLWMNRAPKIYEEKILPEALIPYPSEFNYRQTINDCGPFNVAAVVRSLKEERVQSSDFAESIRWRLPNKYTLPWGLEKQLKDHGLKVETPNVSGLKDEDKILFLQEQLSGDKPVIILGERDEYVGYNYEHYITLFGFNSDKDEFYAYDPFFEKSSEGMTIDSNEDLPGNRTYSSEELLNFWREGGMYGLYKWYSIVAINI